MLNGAVERSATLNHAPTPIEYVIHERYNFILIRTLRGLPPGRSHHGRAERTRHRYQNPTRYSGPDRRTRRRPGGHADPRRAVLSTQREHACPRPAGHRPRTPHRRRRRLAGHLTVLPGRSHRRRGALPLERLHRPSPRPDRRARRGDRRHDRMRPRPQLVAAADGPRAAGRLERGLPARVRHPERVTERQGLRHHARSHHRRERPVSYTHL